MKRAFALALLIALSAPAAFAQTIHCSAPRDAEEAAFCRDVTNDPAARGAPRRVAPAPSPTAAAPAAPPNKSNWRKFEADNGAAFALDMNSIAHMHYCNGCTDVVICILDNGQCGLQNMRRWRFDCHGHYMDFDNGGGVQLAPSRSVAGAMAAIACVVAFPNEPPDQAQSTPAAPRAQSTDSSPANKAFIECLLAQARDGSYATSGPASDGGKSTIMLMGQCKAQWDVWQNECIANGGTDGGPGGCTSKAYLVAFAVLKSLGK